MTPVPGKLVDRKTLRSGRTVDVYQTPDGKLHEKTTGYLTAYGKKWEKEILPAIQKNAREATKRIKKHFGNRGEYFDSSMRGTAYRVIEWLLTTDPRSLPPKVLQAEVNSALDYLEAWTLRTDFLEETLRECSRVSHEYCCLSPVEVADKIDYFVGQVLGEEEAWPAREKEPPVSGELCPDPPLQHDKVLAETQKWLEYPDKPIEMLKLSPKTVKKAKALLRKMVKQDEKRALKNAKVLQKNVKVLCTLPTEPLEPISTKRCFLRVNYPSLKAGA